MNDAEDDGTCTNIPLIVVLVCNVLMVCVQAVFVWIYRRRTIRLKQALALSRQELELTNKYRAEHSGTEYPPNYLPNYLPN